MEEESEDKMSLYALHERLKPVESFIKKYEPVIKKYESIIFRVGFWGFVIRQLIHWIT